MNARVIALLAQTKERWPLAGDQLFVDFDLSAANVPPGTRLAVGSAVVEVTAPPHTGCKKFTERFGADAMSFVNGPMWKPLQLRGVHARVVQPGRIRIGDMVRKVRPHDRFGILVIVILLVLEFSVPPRRRPRTITIRITITKRKQAPAANGIDFPRRLR